MIASIRLYQAPANSLMSLNVQMISINLLLYSICAKKPAGEGAGVTRTGGTDRNTSQTWKQHFKVCDVSESSTHLTNDIPNSQDIVVDGRFDWVVGIIFRPDWLDKPNRRFHSFMLCVEAKIKGNTKSAYRQLVTYLACLRKSCINRGKPDSLVYGAVTDGLKYVFVSIRHESGRSLMSWKEASSCQLFWDICGTFWGKQFRCRQSRP